MMRAAQITKSSPIPRGSPKKEAVPKYLEDSAKDYLLEYKDGAPPHRVRCEHK